MIDDREILELLRDDPELLAIADAVQQTQQPLSARRRPPWRTRAGLGLAACLAIVAAVGAFVLRPTANAGIPEGKYVHVVLRWTDRSEMLVSLTDGSWRPQVHRDEVWVRADGGLAYSLSRVEGRLVESRKETASRATGSLGPVKLNPDLHTGEGVQPLVGVYGGVVDALKQGGRLEAGTSTVFGHRARWIDFPSNTGLRRIAVEAGSGTPVALQEGRDAPLLRILRYHESGKPNLPRPRGTSVGPGKSTPVGDVTAARAAAVLPGALWAGRSVSGLPLRRVLHERLTQAGKRGARPGLTVFYGQSAGTPLPLTRYLYISQARKPERGYQFPGIGSAEPLPPAGFGQVITTGPEGRTRQLTVLVHVHGMYLRIWTNLNSRQLPAIVRTLRPLG